MLLAAQSILQVKTGADIINAPLPPVHPMTPPTMTVDLKTRQFSQRLGALLCCEETANGESKTKSSESIVTLHVVVPPSPRRNGSSGFGLEWSRRTDSRLLK